VKRFILFFPFLLVLAGCSSASLITTNPSEVLKSIVITPATPTMQVGSTLNFTATGTYEDGSTGDITSQVTWSSDTAATATIDTTGLATAIAIGTSNISATLNSISATDKLTVTAQSTATLVSIAVNPSAPSIAGGATQQFHATGTYSDGSVKSLTATATWTSSKTTVATIAAGGLATGVATGTSTITATSGTISGTATLTVTSGSGGGGTGTLVSIAVTPASPSIAVGATQQFKATGTYSDGTTADITATVSWSSSSTSVATISAAGLAKGIGAGSSTIHATSGSITGSATLTVTASGGATLTAITVSPASITINVAATEQYKAMGTYSDGSTADITATATWSSSSTATATIANTGLATGVAAGTTTITASSGSVSGSAILNVNTVTTSAGCDGSGNCYIYASATGSGNGSSWTNAYTGFGTGTGQVSPAKMQRGVTYWIANGNYGGQNFTTPDSGTQIITVIGATPSSHGPATDWDDSFAGTAIFGGAETGMFSDYWAFEGQTRGTDWQSGYTIMFDINGLSGKSGVITTRNSSGDSFSNLFFDYVEVRGSNMNMTYDSGSSSNCSMYCDGGFYTGSPTNNLYVGHSWIHDVGDTQFQSNINSVGNSNGSNWIIEYNYISRDHTGDQSNGAHSEAFSSTVQNMVVRYNYFQDILGSGVITDASGGGAQVGPWYVYGNIAFWTDNANMYSGAGSTSSGLGDGFVSSFGQTWLGTSYIVNNTITNIGVQPHCKQGGVACQMFFLYAAGNGNTTWNIENNLVWNAHGSCVYNGGYSGWTINADYNSVYGGTAGTMQNCGSNAQTVSNTNPFTNWDGSGTQLVPWESLDFSLAADTAAGDPSFANLPAGCTPGKNCMDTDMNGTQFGADGVYERGAVQKQ
jgi:uncharacterized protein YjdB